MDLSTLDLNLLVAFRALVEELHVSRAARRLSLSQPAMSHALARLRQTFNDELLIPTPKGMRLTAKAIALADPVRVALMQLENALGEERPFDAKQTRCTFILAMPDICALIVLPQLERRLREQAPNMDLVVLPSLRGRAMGMVENGAADLSIDRFMSPTKHLNTQIIFRDRLVCFARADNPAFAHKLTLDRYLSLQHLLVQFPGDTSFVDLALDRLGVKRRIVLVLPHYLVVSAMLMETNLVATESERLAQIFQRWTPLVVQPAPFEITMADVAVAWHSRLDHNAAHRWLREQIVELTRDL